MNKTETMEALKNGKKVRLRSWGKNTYIYLNEQNKLVNNRGNIIINDILFLEEYLQEYEYEIYELIPESIHLRNKHLEIKGEFTGEYNESSREYEFSIVEISEPKLFNTANIVVNATDIIGALKRAIHILKHRIVMNKFDGIFSEDEDDE